MSLSFISFLLQTFIVITSRFGTPHVHRLNKAKSVYIFGENHPFRKFSLYITTNQYPLDKILNTKSLMWDVGFAVLVWFFFGSLRTRFGIHLPSSYLLIPVALVPVVTSVSLCFSCDVITCRTGRVSRFPHRIWSSW